MLNRREFAGALAGAAALSAQPPNPPRPNILFILADDLGYGDLGCYGQRDIQTPNLDRLAAAGTRFTQAYAGSTVCAPSRGSLMTGLHTGHAFIRGNANIDLPANTVTAPRILKQAGYRTAMIGKWGLGTIRGTGTPEQQGFDDWFGYLDQVHAHTYYPTELWENGREVFLAGNFGPGRTDYSPDLFTRRAHRFLDHQTTANPFFLYLAYTTPHANNERGAQTGNGMDVPSDEPYGNRNWPQVEKNFAAMVTRMDRDIGSLIDKLKARGILDNTLIVFTSDNGPHREGGHDPDFFHSRGPLRGIKRDLYEGGIRVPAIAHWPGVVPAGVSDVPWAFWDFLPTAAELAGAPAPKITDGRSIVPALKGGAKGGAITGRDYFYWEFHENGFFQGVRQGKWKAVRYHRRSNPIELYDLSSDAGETRNLAAQNPEIVRHMAEIMTNARTESSEFPIKESA